LPRLCAAFCIVAVFALSACAASRLLPLLGPGAVAATRDAAGGTGTLAFTIKVPKHGKLRGRPHENPDWTSPGTESALVTIREPHVKHPKSFFFVLKPKTKGCRGGTATKALVCTFLLAVPSGRDRITIEALGGPKRTSALLAEGSVARTVVSGKKSALRVTMNGAARWLMLWISNPYPPAGTAMSQTLELTALDAWGFVIIGKYEKPLTLKDSDTTGATHLSRKRIVNSQQAAGVALSYSGAPISSAAITVSSKTAKRSSSAALQPGAIGLVAYPQGIFVDLGTPGTPLLVGGTGTALPYTVDTGTDVLGNESCAGLARVAATTTTTYLVAPVAIGECSLDVSDSAGHRLGVPTIVQPEPNPPGNPPPGPSPSPTPALGEVAALPTTITICPSSGSSVCSPSAQPLAISQSGYVGSFRESDDCSAAVAVVTPVSATIQGSTYTIAGGSALGECHATFTGSASHAVVTIDVTASGWIINTKHKGDHQ
jgi:hypothetical protein